MEQELSEKRLDSEISGKSGEENEEEEEDDDDDVNEKTDQTSLDLAVKLDATSLTEDSQSKTSSQSIPNDRHGNNEENSEDSDNSEDFDIERNDNLSFRPLRDKRMPKMNSRENTGGNYESYRLDQAEIKKRVAKSLKSASYSNVPMGRNVMKGREKKALHREIKQAGGVWG